MKARTPGLRGAVALCVLGACRPAPIAWVDAGSSPGDSHPDTAPQWVAARCRPEQAVLSIDDGGALGDLEIGDAILQGDGQAVGVVHRTAAGRVAGVVLIPRGAGVPRVVDLAPTLGDAPPPRLASRARDVVAAAYSAPRAGATGVRELGLYSITPEAPPAPLGTIRQQRDDSLAFDLAWEDSRGIVVWDEAASASRGVVRASVLSADPVIGPPRDVSPPESDAELPRVVPGGGGFVVVWIARSPDPSSAGADASESEVVGEARVHGWLEMLTLDERGAARGPVRRLTPASGHVTAYDVEPLAAGPRAPILVVARDDGEVVDGSGGALLRVRVAGDAAEPPVALATDGLGRGAPTLVYGVAGQTPSLAWVAAHEHLRLLPLDAEGAPGALPSAEPGMDEARPLLWLSAGRMLVATPSDPAAQLRVFSCRPSGT